MPFLLIYITHPNESHASKIVEQLVSEKLVACGNSFPIQSMYWWKGSIEKDSEWVSIVKTTLANWEIVQKRVEALHTYDVPCIIKIEAEANAAYEAWIASEVEG